MFILGINGYHVNNSDEITPFIKMVIFYCDIIYFYLALLCIIFLIFNYDVM